jgi:hypothetical protein
VLQTTSPELPCSIISGKGVGSAAACTVREQVGEELPS